MDVSDSRALVRQVVAPFVAFHAAVQRMVYAVDNTDQRDRVDTQAAASVRGLVRDYVPDDAAADSLARRIVVAVREADERHYTDRW